MSDRNPAGGMGDSVDVDETLVKQRFDAAVGGVSPDVVSLVGGGVAAGRGMRRRRRLQSVVGVVAASALVIGALTLTGAVGNLFNSQGPADRSRTVVELVPATPRGLAAAVMSHTTGLGSLIGVGGADQRDQSGLIVEVGYRTGSGVKVDLQILASPKVRLWARDVNCSAQPTGTCTSDVLPDGTRQVVLQSTGKGSAPPESGAFTGPHVIAVAIKRHDQFVVVLETVVNSGTSPLSVAQVQAIATDPTVGVTTTAELNSRGNDIRGFKDKLSLISGSSSTSSGGGSSTTAPPPVQRSGSASSANPRSGSGSSPANSGSGPNPSPPSESASTAPPAR